MQTLAGQGATTGRAATVKRVAVLALPCLASCVPTEYSAKVTNPDAVLVRKPHEAGAHRSVRGGVAWDCGGCADETMLVTPQGWVASTPSARVTGYRQRGDQLELDVKTERRRVVLTTPTSNVEWVQREGGRDLAYGLGLFALGGVAVVAVPGRPGRPTVGSAVLGGLVMAGGVALVVRGSRPRIVYAAPSVGW